MERDLLWKKQIQRQGECQRWDFDEFMDFKIHRCVFYFCGKNQAESWICLSLPSFFHARTHTHSLSNQYTIIHTNAHPPSLSFSFTQSRGPVPAGVNARQKRRRVAMWLPNVEGGSLKDQPSRNGGRLLPSVFSNPTHTSHTRPPTWVLWLWIMNKRFQNVQTQNKQSLTTFFTLTLVWSAKQGPDTGRPNIPHSSRLWSN